jgi:hypothetical protein
VAGDQGIREKRAGCAVAADVVGVGMSDHDQRNILGSAPNRPDRRQVDILRGVGQPGVDQHQPVAFDDIHRHRFGIDREGDPMHTWRNFRGRSHFHCLSLIPNPDHTSRSENVMVIRPTGDALGPDASPGFAKGLIVIPSLRGISSPQRTLPDNRHADVCDHRRERCSTATSRVARLPRRREIPPSSE